MTRRWARAGLVMAMVGSGVLAAVYGASLAGAQGIDCARLAAQISALGRGGGGGSGQYAAAAQRQRAELARTSAYANSIGCNKPDFFLFGERPAQCGAINGQIARMQANLQGLQSAGGGDNGRASLQARFDAYCRGGDAPGSTRGFFEQLFGGGSRPAYDEQQPEVMQPTDDDAAERGSARGGSQAVCVRTCDGGFFPLSVGARQRPQSDLQDLCAAQCPGVETKLYTRSPGSDISTAASLAGEAYVDLPNALKFQKTFDRTCACKPADKSWSDVLANAEKILGDERRGDILVTPEKAEELSRVAGPAGAKVSGRKFDPRAIARTISPVPGASDAPAIAPAGRPTADGGAAAIPSDGDGKGGVRVIPR